MANMGYCRFQNTLGDLEDCLDALYEGEALSADEASAARRLMEVAAEIVAMGPAAITTTDEE